MYIYLFHIPFCFSIYPFHCLRAHLWQSDLFIICRTFASTRKGKLKSNKQSKPSCTSYLNCFVLLKQKLFCHSDGPLLSSSSVLVTFFPVSDIDYRAVCWKPKMSDICMVIVGSFPFLISSTIHEVRFEFCKAVFISVGSQQKFSINEFISTKVSLLPCRLPVLYATGFIVIFSILL